MTIQITGTGLNNIGINPNVQNSGQFTSLNTTTGAVSTSVGQSFNFNTNGTNKAQLDSSGNFKLLNSVASFQNALGDAITPYAAFRNKLINGNFDIWQRGVTQTATGYGSDDRWINTHVGSSVVHSRFAFTVGQTAVPNNPKYYSRTAVTSINGAANVSIKYQLVEDVTKSSGKTYTLSFWAKADTNRNIAVEFIQYFGTGGTPSAQVDGLGVATCALTSAWQKFTKTVTFPSIAGKTLGTNENDAFGPVFWFEGGSNYNARNNSLGQQSGTFDIAQVQLEEGPVATPFEDRPQEIEFSLAQRYYEVIGGINGTLAVNSYSSVGGDAAALYISYNVTKRKLNNATKFGTWATLNINQPVIASATINDLSLVAQTASTGVGTSFFCDTADDYIIIDAEIM